MPPYDGTKSHRITPHFTGPMTDDISEADELEERWPRDGDRLFVEVSWGHDAHLVRDPKERFYRLPMGYKRAADLLIERAAADVVDRANVIYGALFCYRQSIELFLKRLIDEFGTQTSPPKQTHDLSVLWDRFMDVVKARGREDTGGLDAAQALVAEMHNADDRSDGFRYPVDAKGRPFAFGDQGIDLVNLLEVMSGLQNFFECAYLDFSHQDDVGS
jgi:hypothetical protein